MTAVTHVCVTTNKIGMLFRIEQLEEILLLVIIEHDAVPDQISSYKFFIINSYEERLTKRSPA